jgi:hypothetical protein
MKRKICDNNNTNDREGKWSYIVVISFVKLEEENIEGDSCGMNNSTILNTNRF